MIVMNLKVVILFTLFVLTFLLGVIPVFVKKIIRKRSENEAHVLCYKRIFSFLSCYAAGVFLGTGILDLLPSVRVDIGRTLDQFNIFTSFPVAEFVMMFGLFLILIIEQIVLTIKERSSNETSEELNERSPLLASTDSLERVTRSYSEISDHSYEGISDVPYSRTSRHCDDCQERVSVDAVPSTESNKDVGPHHEHSSLRALLLIVALSLHSVFEGLAVGLQRKSEDVLDIFAALVIHKSVLSFSIGMNLIQSQLSQAGIIRSIFVFSLTSPIGIGIGIIIMDLWDTSSSVLVQGILTGIACGTFLYVTFFEVLPCEFNTHDQRLMKVLFLILGFATITGVLFLQNDDGPTCYVTPSPT